jgi:hypothetical protein
MRWVSNIPGGAQKRVPSNLLGGSILEGLGEGVPIFLKVLIAVPVNMTLRVYPVQTVKGGEGQPSAQAD